MIDLHPATSLFMLAGGPGQSLIAADSMMLFSDAFLGPLLDDRDVVILDQRGSPHTQPVLDCPEMYGLPWEIADRELDDAGALDLGRQVLANCVASARAEGIDLAQYNSVRIAGDLDARTPVIRSELVAATLPRATIVEFPQGTHVQLGEVNRCVGRILQALLADPSATPDTGCIADMPKRGFVLPDGTMSND